MNNNEKKTSEAQIRACKKYANSKYRPSIYFDMDMKADIERRYKMLGFESVNQYITSLVTADLGYNDLDIEVDTD